MVMYWSGGGEVQEEWLEQLFQTMEGTKKRKRDKTLSGKERMVVCISASSAAFSTSSSVASIFPYLMLYLKVKCVTYKNKSHICNFTCGSCLPDCVVKEDCILRHDPAGCPKAGLTEGPHVHAIEHHLAFRHIEQPEQQLGYRGLAAARAGTKQLVLA